MTQYRKKPIVVDAVQWDGDPETIENFIQDGSLFITPKKVIINTFEGPMYVQLGDWIIQNIYKKYYSCKPDFFAENYEQVEL